MTTLFQSRLTMAPSPTPSHSKRLDKKKFTHVSSEAVIDRQLQTKAVPNPYLKHKMYPETYPDATCRVCRKAPARLEHIIWDCLAYPDESNTRTMPPAFEEAVRTEDQNLQLLAVQRVNVALARQEDPGDPVTGSGGPLAGLATSVVTTPAKS